MRVPLTGFAPDLDPTTPGVVVDCDAIIPTTQGLAAAKSLTNAGLPALATTPTAAFVTQLLDGTKRMFVASATKIYEAASGSWTDRSRAGNYAGSNKQRFCVFGNNVLATNRAEPIGQAVPGGAFTDIAGAPDAAVICSVNGFVMAFDTNDGTYGDRPDGWWCSGIRDQTVWTPSAATQAANGRFYDTPGRVTAAAALGSDCVAYKGTSMFLGRYVGPPIIWAWQRVPGDIGCASAESLVTIGTKHFFVGPDDFYVFDGTVPQPIGQDVREWFFTDLNETYRANIVGAVDLPRSLVYWYYSSTSATVSGTLDSVLIYNYVTGKWGKRALTVQTPVLYVSGGVTFESLGSMYATYDDLPSIPYDSPFWLADHTVPGVFQDNILYPLTGDPGVSWLKTGDFGDMTGYSFLSRVTPRYRFTPDQSHHDYDDPTATNYYRDNLGVTATFDGTVTWSRERFDFRRSARWHSVKLTHDGPMTLDGLDVEFKRMTKE